MYKEIHIIGAGVAGLLLANNMINNGIKPNVYEQKKDIKEGNEPSGIVSIEAYNRLGFDAREAVMGSLYGARLHVNKKTFIIESKEKRAIVLDRTKLNEILFKSIKDKTNLVMGKRLDSNAIKGLKGLIVGADGYTSIVANTFGFPPINRFILTYRAEYDFKNNEKLVDLYFGEYSKGLFAWVSPEGNKEIEVGIGIDSRYGNAKKMFERFLKEENLDFGKPKKEYAYAIPMEWRKRFVKDNVLLIGDAAGQTKPISGGGISMLTKIMPFAIEAIKKEKLSIYENKVKKLLKKELFIQNRVRWYYYSKNRMYYLLKFANSIGLLNGLSKYGIMDSLTTSFKRIILRR